MNICSPLPVVIDTDIGNDIDDTWALGMALKMPELNLRYVLSCSGDTEYRARVAAHYLNRTGYSGVPVGIGVAAPNQDAPESMHARLGDFTLRDYPGPVHRDGVRHLIELVQASAQPVTIIGIGPMTNLAEFCRRAPEAVRNCRLVAMLGSIRRRHFGELGAVAEYNARIDVPAAQTVFAAPWREVVMTPLDHCGTLRLAGERYRKLKASNDPVVTEIIGCYQTWRAHFQKTGVETESSILYDVAAVYLASSEKFIEFETLKCVISDDGFTRISDFGRPVKVATGWSDFEGFLDDLTTLFLKNTKIQQGISHETKIYVN